MITNSVRKGESFEFNHNYTQESHSRRNPISKKTLNKNKLYQKIYIISILLTITMIFCITSSIQLSASAATTEKVESNDYYTYTDQYGEWEYKWTNAGNSYKITDYSGSMSDIEIPATINNIPVL